MKNFGKAFQANVALEAQATDVKAGRETEVVIYARITDFEGLKKASSKQSQEQWQVNGPFGKIRVRNEAHEGVEGTYTMAIKSKDSILGGAETEMGIDGDVFNAFKVISDNGMIKDRYTFPTQRTMLQDNSGRHNIPIADLVFEVDVFKKPDGSYHEWCKIDLEIDSILEAVKGINGSIETANLNINVSSLPFRPMEMIDNTMKDQATRDKITQLYETVFLTKRTNEQAGGPADGAGATEEPLAPTVAAEPQPAAPAPAEPAVEPATPDTGELTGVDNPPPAETAEAPTLAEPAAVAPVEEAPVAEPAAEEPKAADAPVPDVSAPQETGEAKPIPIVKLEEAAAKSETGAAPETSAPAEQAPAESAPAVTEEPATQEPVTEEPAAAPAEPAAPEPAPEPTAPDAEEPAVPVDPDTVVEAGGSPDAPDEATPGGLTEDKVRLLMREEIAAALAVLNDKTK